MSVLLLCIRVCVLQTPRGGGGDKKSTTTVMSQLPLPQSYPPNTAPEIDPATLCFESPISLSSNDTSLNGSQPGEHITQHTEHIINNNPTMSSSVNYPECGTNIQHAEPTITEPVNVNNLQNINSDNTAAPVTASEPLVRGDSTATEQQQRLADFMDTIPDINTEQKQAPAAVVTSSEYPATLQQTNNPAAVTPQQQQQNKQCYATTQQHPSPQNLNIQHTSPQNVTHQQHHSPMFPPQSPQVVIPNSPHLAPQSPQITQKSPLLHPMSPHIPPQSPHYNTTTGTMPSPGVQQTTPYTYRNRAGSMSKATPPDLTPPPGTPSPSKPSPDRYQQYLQQSRVSLKSPNVTITGREMQYPAGGLSANPANATAAVNNNMQPQLNMMHYQQHQAAAAAPGAAAAAAAMSNQHFFPANQYMDTRYLNHYQMQQIAQVTQPAAAMYGQLPTNHATAAGMYGYYP